MIDCQLWVREIIAKLEQQFGCRLLFVGLQGSYLRNEASETSDLDVMVVLDELALEDLQAYRSLIKTMPEQDKACGFVCGREDLLNWPRQEIFQLRQDTKSCYGDLDSLLPDCDEADIRRSVHIAAANLYHAVCHQYIFGNEGARVDDLQPLYKSVFFILQLVEYLRSGVYRHTKAELLGCLAGDEKQLLATGMEWQQQLSEIRHNPDAYYDKLARWCKALLRA